MTRVLLVLAFAAALAGCDTFGDYKVQVKDPTARQDVREPTYYDYKRRETVFQR